MQFSTTTEQILHLTVVGVSAKGNVVPVPSGASFSFSPTTGTPSVSPTSDGGVDVTDTTAETYNIAVTSNTGLPFEDASIDVSNIAAAAATLRVVGTVN